MKLVNPAKRKYSVIVVGTGLAGASAAATLAELGYKVHCFCYQDSPRRRPLDRRPGRDQRRQELPERRRQRLPPLLRHRSRAATSASREANVYRLAEVCVNIIDQCVAQGVPFAREYGGLLANRSFGGAQVSRTFYCRGQTGQQLLLGAYQALEPADRRSATVKMHPRTEMLDLVVVDGRARGIVVRDLVTGKIESSRRPTPSSWPPAATATSSSSRPTPRAATSRRPGGPTSAGPRSPTRATRRSTRPASP